MPPHNVKNDPQRPKHTAQRQGPGKCLHSLWAETFHGQALASQENTPQCSAAISNLWFSSSPNFSLSHLLLHSQGFQEPSPSLVSASLQNTSQFFSLVLFALVLFFSLTFLLQDKYPQITTIIARKKGCLNECKSSVIFTGCHFRVWGELVWKDRRSRAQASSWATRSCRWAPQEH